MEVIKRYDQITPAHEVVCLPNAASFSNTFFSQPLTSFAQGWNDPSNLEVELEFVAPSVEVPRYFQWRKHDNKSAFYTESNDERHIGGDFKKVEYKGELVTDRTINRGLQVIVDLDEVGDDTAWQERYTSWLLRRMVRNDLVTAGGLLFAGASNTAKTWDSSADPDDDLMSLVDASGDLIGFNPNRIYSGSAAWQKRVRAFRAQDNAGARASAMMTPDQVAAWLGIDQLFVSKSRYQSTATAKAKIVGSQLVAFQAESGMMAKEDASNIKRFVSRCGDGSFRRVYVREISEKLMGITVERYVKTVITATTGLKKYTVS